MTRPARSFIWPLFGLFILCVLAANWATQRWGFVSLGPWEFTAGTYAAGLSFGVRDALHEAGGRTRVIAAIVVGAALSWLVAPSLAVASGVAFLLSEFADLCVYAPLRERRWVAAVIASNLVGAMVDTAVFLGIAFGAAAVTADAMVGQLVGKALMIAPALLLVRWVRGAR
jgi:uncharacterized PurR-regulated membrane protein YhhQ (DUF165 family)